MLGNSSSSLTANLVQRCFNSKDRQYIFIGFFTVKSILNLPLSTFILHMGYQRWRQQRSFNTASHSDVFSFHQAAMELFWGFSLVFYLCGLYADSLALTMMAFVFMSFGFYGECFFHVLTCVERYLAVIHPITYRGLRNTHGVRIRNICIGCAWFLSFGLQCFHVDREGNCVVASILFVLVCSIILMCFCSFSVLYALIRPGPGEGGGERERIHQSKLKAFYTISAILSALWLWFVGAIVVNALQVSNLLSESVICVLTAGSCWFNLPSCLVSPVLFLHRAGKLSCNCFK